MDKEITYEEFAKSVSEWWATDVYKYGSVQFPAKTAKQAFIEQGVTNAEEMYSEYKRKMGDFFYYAGD